MRAWTITFGEKSWTDDQVLTAHAVAVAELIGDSWDAVDPWKGPKSLAAWLTVLIASELGGDMESALTTVYALSVDALIDTLAGREAPPASPVREPVNPHPTAPVTSTTATVEDVSFVAA